MSVLIPERKRCRQSEKRCSHLYHSASPRIAIGKAFAERQPEFLAVRTAHLAYPSPLRRFDCRIGKDNVEVPPPPRLAVGHYTVRTAPVFSNTYFNRRKRGFTAGQLARTSPASNLPQFAQLVDLWQSRLKCFPLHTVLRHMLQNMLQKKNNTLIRYANKAKGSVYKSYGFMVCSFQIRGINDHGLQAVSGMALGD